MINKLYKNEKIKNLIILLLGNLILAFGTSFFLANYHGVHYYGNGTEDYIELNGILSGGTTSFSLIIQSLFNLNSSSIEVVITCVTVALFFLGLIFMGKKFAMHTLVSTIVYPVFLFLFKLSIFDSFRNEILIIDPFVAGVIGGVLMGYGCGIVYKIGGSTGGFDIPGMIVNKYTRIKLSLVFLVSDGILVLLSLVAGFHVYEIIIGLASVVAYSIVVEYCQVKGTHAYICEIISDKWEDINKDILLLDRGTTLIDGYGGYTKNPKKIIRTMVGKNQYLAILDIVKKHDPKAFMSMHETHDIFGEGYKDINNYTNK